jgi:hypothetical protein
LCILLLVFFGLNLRFDALTFYVRLRLSRKKIWKNTPFFCQRYSINKNNSEISLRNFFLWLLEIKSWSNFNALLPISFCSDCIVELLRWLCTDIAADKMNVLIVFVVVCVDGKIYPITTKTNPFSVKFSCCTHQHFLTFSDSASWASWNSEAGWWRRRWGQECTFSHGQARNN